MVLAAFSVLATQIMIALVRMTVGAGAGVALLAAAQSARQPSREAAAVRAARSAQNTAIAGRDLDRAAAFWTDDVVIRSGLGRVIRAAARFQPEEVEGWWRRANILWFAAREYQLHHQDCDAVSQGLDAQDPGALGELQVEYELAASALLAMRHAADAYRRTREGLQQALELINRNVLEL
jgi:ketosteroid isomerase-like protein